MMSENMSVKSFLEDNPMEMLSYFMECKVYNKKPNYSEFCRNYLNGETREGVAFDSIKIKRKELTEVLRKKYSLWSQLSV